MVSARRVSTAHIDHYRLLGPCALAERRGRIAARELLSRFLPTPSDRLAPQSGGSWLFILHRRGMGVDTGVSPKRLFVARYPDGHSDARWTETTRQSTGAGVPISASLRSHSLAAGSASMLVNDSWLSHWA